jgi:hypothetical protein
MVLVPPLTTRPPLQSVKRWSNSPDLSRVFRAEHNGRLVGPGVDGLLRHGGTGSISRVAMPPEGGRRRAGASKEAPVGCKAIAVPRTPGVVIKIRPA